MITFLGDPNTSHSDTRPKLTKGFSQQKFKSSFTFFFQPTSFFTWLHLQDGSQFKAGLSVSGDMNILIQCPISAHLNVAIWPGAASVHVGHGGSSLGSALLAKNFPLRYCQ